MIVEAFERGGTRYEVRSHGASVRLYTNGVFHSQWNEGRPFAGGVWDCLSLPVLYRDPAAVRRVLVLGRRRGRGDAPARAAAGTAPRRAGGRT